MNYSKQHTVLCLSVLETSMSVILNTVKIQSKYKHMVLLDLKPVSVWGLKFGATSESIKTFLKRV